MRFRSSLVALLLVAGACAGTPEVVETTVPVVTTSSVAGGPATTTADVIVEAIERRDLPNGLDFATEQWSTDWSRRTVELDSIFLGIRGPDPRDRIAPLDNPQYDSIADSDWIEDNEPGVLLTLGDIAQFYPLSVMTRHEIVNDVVGDVPVSVTFCPLCNTGIVFDRRFEGDVLRLGVSGLLRRSDMVMWDDATDSLWQQLTGIGIVGEHAGDQLTIIPSRIVSFGSFAREFPTGLALSEDQEFGYRYGQNPYAGYSSAKAPIPSFFHDVLDPRLPALSRVVGVDEGGVVKGYAFDGLQAAGAVNDVVGGVPVAIFWGDEATSDALDARSISGGVGIGTASAYLSTVDGSILTFESVDDLTFRDLETGTTWSILGKAIEGPLAGKSLEVAVHRNEFFFAWAAFFPKATLWEGP